MKSPVIDISTRRRINPHRKRLSERAKKRLKLERAGWRYDGEGTYSLEHGPFVYYVTKRGDIWEIEYFCPKCAHIHRPGAAWDDPWEAMAATIRALVKCKTPVACAEVYDFRTAGR